MRGEGGVNFFQDGRERGCSPGGRQGAMKREVGAGSEGKIPERGRLLKPSGGDINIIKKDPKCSVLGGDHQEGASR